MSKLIPVEYIVALYNELIDLSPKDSRRIEFIDNAAKQFNVSVSTIRRALKKQYNLKNKKRSDCNKPRKLSYEDIITYCKAIAVLQESSSNKKGRHLSTARAIWVLETVGINIDGKSIKLQKNLLTKCMANRYLKKLGLTRKQRLKQPACVRFQAESSNDCWQLDFTESEFRAFPEKIGVKNKKLYLASVIDDRSGVVYQEYFLAQGENATDALKFLFNAMSQKENFILQGIPKMIYLDNGPVAKSTIFKRVMNLLGVIIQTHMPRGSDGRRVTARSKGKVERSIGISQDQFETLFHFNKPDSLQEANKWLWSYLYDANDLLHRNSNHSRNEDWKKNIPQEGYRKMCSWERYCQMAREPIGKKVEPNACLILDGIPYQLLPEMAGETVTVLLGVFDYEIYVEFNDEKFGPFYKADLPIQLNEYRSFKKTKSEELDAEIVDLAKRVKVPREIMTLNYQDEDIMPLLNKTNLIDNSHDKYIPFQELSDDDISFKDSIEAKLAIAKYLGKPLSILLESQIEKINEFVSESLNKKILMDKVKQFFTLKPCVSQ